MRKVLALSTFLFLMGCQSDVTRYWAANCTKQGWTAGTPEHDGCVDQQHMNYVKGFAVMTMPMGGIAPQRHCYTSESGQTSCY